MIGCGAIARQYLDTARRLDAIEIVAAADRVPARATAVEAAEGIPAMPVADLLANAEVDVVLNLTDSGRPRRHRPPWRLPRARRSTAVAAGWLVHDRADASPTGPGRPGH